MKFKKMHGLGNDFIMVNGAAETLPKDINAFAMEICDRHLGVGADGLIVVSPGEGKFDLKMSIYNADGSEAEMCGNGIRCAHVFARAEGLSDKTKINFSTLGGPVVTEMVDADKNLVRVNMGRPRLAPEEIPAQFNGSRVVKAPLKVNGKTYDITLVNMGNPHCVIFVDSVEDFPVVKIGPQIENHPLFPAKINVEFVQFINADRIKMRVWERGCGETLACGTGACAAAVASILKGFCHNAVEVELPHGSLFITWHLDDYVELVGPAATVFAGEYLNQ